MSKPRPIFLNAREAIARAENRLGCVVRPVKEIEGYVVKPADTETGVAYWNIGECRGVVIPCRSPYRPGDVVPLKEAWGLHTGCQWDHNACVYYKTGSRKMIYWMDQEDMKGTIHIIRKYGHDLRESECPRQSIKMPSWAIRPGNHPTVKSVECVRVDKMPFNILMALGAPILCGKKSNVDNAYQDWMKSYWLSRYPVHPWETSHAFIIKFEESK